MAEGGRRGCSERPRRRTGDDADGRDSRICPHRAGGRDRDRRALLLPRSEPVGHDERPGGSAGSRPAQHPRDHRGPSENGPVSRRHGGVRHRFHRPHESGVTPEPRTGPRRQPAGGARVVRDRRGREPGGGRARAGARAMALEGGGGRRVRSHAAGLRRGGAGRLPRQDRARGDADSHCRRHLAAREPSECGVPEQRGPRDRRSGSAPGAHAEGAGRGQGAGPSGGMRDRA